MMVNNLKSKSPIHQLFFLILIVGIGFIISLFLTSIIGGIIYGQSFINNPDAILQNTSFIRFAQIIQVFFLFFVPSIIFLNLFGTDKDQESLKAPSPLSLLLFGALIMIVSLPFIDFTATINQQFKFPEALSFIESWMTKSENELNQLTIQLLDTEHIPTILVNIAIMVVLPAFCEEIFFRGIIQNKLSQWLKNGHIAILITAFIFSAIHMQFMTFLPRFFLGIALGYMLFWGGSLWISITGHFINNGTALIFFYYYRINHPEINPLDTKIESTSNPIAYTISLLLMIGLLYGLKKKREQYINSH